MDMDITKLTDQDLAYIEGFVQKCAEHGVDPEQLLEKRSACAGKKKGKAFGGKAAPVFAKKSEAAAEKLAAAIRKLAEDEGKEKKKDGRVMKAVKGTAAGAATGAALAGAAGGAASAAALRKARSAPGLAGMAARRHSGDRLTAYLRAIALGARKMAPAGAAAGGFTGGVTGASV